MARALLDVASNLGNSQFIGIKKWPRSLDEDSGELLPLRYVYRAQSGRADRFHGSSGRLRPLLSTSRNVFY